VGEPPEYFVTGTASVTRVSAGVIRETFYVEDDRTERRAVLRDADAWFAARRALAAADPHQVAARQEGDSLMH
jgi:hypothetical protein